MQLYQKQVGKEGGGRKYTRAVKLKVMSKSIHTVIWGMQLLWLK